MPYVHTVFNHTVSSGPGCWPNGKSEQAWSPQSAAATGTRRWAFETSKARTKSPLVPLQIS